MYANFYKFSLCVSRAKMHQTFTDIYEKWPEKKGLWATAFIDTLLTSDDAPPYEKWPWTNAVSNG